MAIIRGEFKKLLDRVASAEAALLHSRAEAMGPPPGLFKKTTREKASVKLVAKFQIPDRQPTHTSSSSCAWETPLPRHEQWQPVVRSDSLEQAQALVITAASRTEARLEDMAEAGSCEHSGSGSAAAPGRKFALQVLEASKNDFLFNSGQDDGGADLGPRARREEIVRAKQKVESTMTTLRAELPEEGVEQALVEDIQRAIAQAEADVKRARYKCADTVRAAFRLREEADKWPRPHTKISHRAMEHTKELQIHARDVCTWVHFDLYPGGGKRYEAELRRSFGGVISDKEFSQLQLSFSKGPGDRNWDPAMWSKSLLRALERRRLRYRPQRFHKSAR